MDNVNIKIKEIVHIICDHIILKYKDHYSDSNTKDEKFICCIAGPPASGKSTISELLIKELNKRLESSTEAVIIGMDGYHLDNSILIEKQLLNRKGSPPTFDSIGFLHMLNRLKEQGITNKSDNDDDNIKKSPIYIPTFDRNIDLSKAGSFTVETFNKILIIEGNYLLLNQQPWCKLKQLFNLSIYIKVDIDQLENRLIQRWVTHNHDLESAKDRALSNDIPNAILVSNNSNLDNVFIIENNE